MNFIETLSKKIEIGNFWDESLVLERNEFLKFSGSIDTNLYFIKEGSLRVFVMDELEEHTIRFGYKNNFIASLDSFITEQASHLYIQALKKTHLKVISKKPFLLFFKTGSQLNKQVLTEFLEQQNQMIDLLEHARNLSLNKTKCAITISKWIKLKLGDTFRFIIYHHQRHIVQVEKILEEVSFQ